MSDKKSNEAFDNWKKEMPNATKEEILLVRGLYGLTDETPIPVTETPEAPNTKK